MSRARRVPSVPRDQPLSPHGVMSVTTVGVAVCSGPSVDACERVYTPTDQGFNVELACTVVERHC